MRSGDSAESPLEAAVGAAGPQATEAFKQLGNETRLAILVALWEAYDPFDDDNAVPFSVLRERVGMRDKGQFYYHLDKLVGRFVRKSSDGYELRNAGRKIVRAVIAGTGRKQTTFTPTEIDKACPHCDGPVMIAYEDEWLFQICTHCEGTFADSDEFRPGTLTVWPFTQAGLSDRTPEEMFVTGAIATMVQYTMMASGICPDCFGRADTSLDICHEHAPPPAALCPACERRYPIQARFVCTVCKNKMWGPPSILVLLSPTAIAFYADRGIELGYTDPDLEAIAQLLTVIREHDQATLITPDPPLITVTLRCHDDQLHLTLDEHLNVRDVEVEQAHNT